MLPPNPTASACNGAQQDNAKPRARDRRHNHPHSIAKRDCQQTAQLLVDLVVCDEHEREVRGEDDAPDDGANDGNDEHEDGHELGAEEDGRQQSRERDARRDRVKHKEDGEALEDRLCDLGREAREVEHVLRDAVAQLRRRAPAVVREDRREVKHARRAEAPYAEAEVRRDGRRGLVRRVEVDLEEVDGFDDRQR